jgi:hypothetical protein
MADLNPRSWQLDLDLNILVIFKQK